MRSLPISDAVRSDEEKIKEFMAGCKHKNLTNDADIKKLYLKGKVTIDELNQLTRFQIKALIQPGVWQRIMDGDLTLSELNPNHMFNQTHLIKQILKFCRRYNDKVTWTVDSSGTKVLGSKAAAPDTKEITEDRFSKDFITQITNKKGFCAGLTTMFLANAYLQSREDTKENKLETKEIQDNLREFYRVINKIASWEGEPLDEPTQKLFRNFIHQMFQFQDMRDVLLVDNFRIDRYLFLSKDQKEISEHEKNVFPFSLQANYVMTVTKEQLAKKLEELKRTNHLVYLSFEGHATGLFNDRFFDSNAEGGDFSADTVGISNWIYKFYKKKNFDKTSPVMKVTYSAFKYRDMPEVKYPAADEILADCADPTVKDIYGYTPLHWAARMNDVASLKIYLSKKNCDINATNKDGNSALIEAASFDSTDTIKELLENKNCNINLQTNLGRTALMAAAERNHENTVEMLLQHPTCDLNIRAFDGKTALTQAAIFGNVNIVKALLTDTKCDIDSKDNGHATPLIFAIKNGHVDVARLLIQNGANFDYIPKDFYKNENNKEAQRVYEELTKEIYIQKEIEKLTLNNLIRKNLLNKSTADIVSSHQIYLFHIIYKTLSFLPEEEVKEEKTGSLFYRLTPLLEHLKNRLERWSPGPNEIANHWLTAVKKELTSVDLIDFDRLSSHLKNAVTSLEIDHYEETVKWMKVILNYSIFSTEKPMTVFTFGVFSLSPSDYAESLKRILDSRDKSNVDKMEEVLIVLNKINYSKPDLSILNQIQDALACSPVAMQNLANQTIASISSKIHPL